MVTTKVYGGETKVESMFGEGMITWPRSEIEEADMEEIEDE